MISHRNHPHLCNATSVILFSCFPNSIFTCIVNYWPVNLETWVEGKWRNILQVCSVANAGGKKFLDTQSIYQNLWLYHVYYNKVLIRKPILKGALNSLIWYNTVEGKENGKLGIYFSALYIQNWQTLPFRPPRDTIFSEKKIWTLTLGFGLADTFVLNTASAPSVIFEFLCFWVTCGALTGPWEGVLIICASCSPAYRLVDDSRNDTSRKSLYSNVSTLKSWNKFFKNFKQNYKLWNKMRRNEKKFSKKLEEFDKNNVGKIFEKILEMLQKKF